MRQVILARGGVGGTVDSKSALRSAGIILLKPRHNALSVFPDCKALIEKDLDKFGLGFYVWTVHNKVISGFQAALRQGRALVPRQKSLRLFQ
ncbi:hypothetical protein PoB_006824600 [Plakobranchus ocellatus]|uniref:Uncharacterized protein n=1 Tax=Plakobranchus ocellatus TaxID=259542 RepID=A0AAV4DC86_9GAST|nr:hypothetical protein PoB_006824600 [Plakobranchus ocellatus]